MDDLEVLDHADAVVEDSEEVVDAALVADAEDSGHEILVELEVKAEEAEDLDHEIAMQNHVLPEADHLIRDLVPRSAPLQVDTHRVQVAPSGAVAALEEIA